MPTSLGLWIPSDNRLSKYISGPYPFQPRGVWHSEHGCAVEQTQLPDVRVTPTPGGCLHPHSLGFLPKL